MAVIDLRTGGEGAKYLAIAKLLTDLSQRQADERMLDKKFQYEKDLTKFGVDAKASREDSVAKQVEEAIRAYIPSNRPQVPTESELPVTGLGDLSGMAGVAGSMSPEEGVNRALAPKPTSVPTQPTGASMTGDIGETRSMSDEEIIPELIARLSAAKVQAPDIERIVDMMVNRNDYNRARGSGLGGPGKASPFQNYTADMGDAALANKNADTLYKMAAADQGVDPNAGMFVTLTDKNGQIVGFYNPKTEAFKENPVAGSRRGGLPTTELNRRGMLTTMRTQLDNVKRIAEANRDSVGGFAGWRGKLTALQNAIGGNDPESPKMLRVSDDESSMIRELANVGDMILRARSGAQINEQEATRLRHLVPSIGDPDFWAKLESFQRELDVLIGSTVESGGIKIGGNSVSPQGAPAGNDPLGILE